MKHPTPFNLLLPLVIITAMLFPGQRSLSQPEGAKAPPPMVIVHYFHGTVRCKTCNTIESYTKEAVPLFFAKELKDRRLELKTADIDQKENEHYVEEFQLMSSSVVLEIVKGGKRTKWKLLPKVWQFVHTKDRFFKYIEDEVKSYMKEIS